MIGTITVQKRTHKKKRINKKWLKRYGTKTITIGDHKLIENKLNDLEEKVYKTLGIPEKILYPNVKIKFDLAKPGMDFSVIEDQGGIKVERDCINSMAKNKYCFHAKEDQCQFFGVSQNEKEDHCKISLHIPEPEEEKELVPEIEEEEKERLPLYKKIIEGIKNILMKLF